jgi:hypothetical protein
VFRSALTVIGYEAFLLIFPASIPRGPELAPATAASLT